MRGRSLLFVWVFLILLGCGKEEENLPSVEEREQKSISELKEELTAPAQGWKLAYRPTIQTGVYSMLLQFREDGTLRIQSDVTINEGKFKDHVVNYRIDSSQGIELILETYGVFHYFFELNRASFGGEFEFVYEGKEGANLKFSSKSDVGPDVSILTFTPATATDVSSIASEIEGVLLKGQFQETDLGRLGGYGVFNFHLKDFGYLMSAAMDMEKRTIQLLGIAEGKNKTEVFANDKIASLDLKTPFSYDDDRLILGQPLSFSFDGKDFTLSEVAVQNAESAEETFCTGQTESLIKFTGSDTGGIGNYDATSSLFQVKNAFQPTSNNPFSVNYRFLYDQNEESIADQIENVFPDVQGFQWYHGYQIADSTFNGMGFIAVDNTNNVEFFLRGYDYTQEGNLLKITFNDKNLTPKNATPEELSGLGDITDQMFSGGEVYIMELANGNRLFKFYNPCNRYRGFLLLRN